MELEFEAWPDLLELGDAQLLAELCEDSGLAAVEDDAGFLDFVEAEDGPPPRARRRPGPTDEPGGLSIPDYEAASEPSCNCCSASHAGPRPKRKRRPRPAPPVKTPAEVAANAAAFHAWQRRRRPMPPLWSDVDGWVVVGRK